MTGDPWVTVIAVACAALAAGFTGFGFNLVAVPLLVVALGPREAVIVALILGLLATAILSLGAWRRREVDRRLLELLMLGSAPGLAVGTLCFDLVGALALKIAIAAISIGGALLLMANTRFRARRVRPGEAVAVGLVAGLFAATTGTGGPPVVTYVNMASVDLEVATVRGTIVAQIALVSLLALRRARPQRQRSPCRVEGEPRARARGHRGPCDGGRLFRRSPHAVYAWATNATLLGIGVTGLMVALR